MSAAALHAVRNAKPTDADIDAAMAGNLLPVAILYPGGYPRRGYELRCYSSKSAIMKSDDKMDATLSQASLHDDANIWRHGEAWFLLRRRQVGLTSTPTGWCMS